MPASPASPSSTACLRSARTAARRSRRRGITTLVANGNHSLSAVCARCSGQHCHVSDRDGQRAEHRHRRRSQRRREDAAGRAGDRSPAPAARSARVTSANSPTVAIGNIISQSPAAGMNVASGSSVAFVLALGARVPNVVGSTQSAATTAITTAGLTVGTVTDSHVRNPRRKRPQPIADREHQRRARIRDGAGRLLGSGARRRRRRSRRPGARAPASKKPPATRSIRRPRR